MVVPLDADENLFYCMRRCNSIHGLVLSDKFRFCNVNINALTFSQRASYIDPNYRKETFNSVIQAWLKSSYILYFLRRYSILVITTAQLNSAKSELWFCAGSNPAHGVS